MSFKDTPIICSPYDMPGHHYALYDEGQPTGKKLDGRRESTYLVPVPLPRRRVRAQAELGLEVEGAKSRVSENHLVVNRLQGSHEIPPDTDYVTKDSI